MGLIIKLLSTKTCQRLNTEQMTNLQNRRLAKLVQYARANSPYYAELYKNITSDFSLCDLPATNKVELMANFDSAVTDSAVTMSKLNEFMSNNDNVGRLFNGKYLVSKTSGSTGNPAIVLYDKNNIDVASAVAALRTFSRKEDLRRFMKNGKRTAGVFANYGFYLACGMSRYLQLQMPHRKNKITVDVNADESEIVAQLNAFQPSMLSGYPSNLALLADNRELCIKPDVVITGGELLTDEIRTKLKSKFGCYVQTHYSCTEAGEIACECEYGKLHINEDWVIVEPVDTDNNPVGFDVLSDKVLITCLSNYIQPFIRYELTDRIIVHDRGCRCGKNTRWLEIEGRTDETLIFDNGVSIAPMSFYKLLEEVESVARFQLVQRAANVLELRLAAENTQLAFRQAKASLLSFLQSKGVGDVEIVLSSLVPQANKTSGKFQHIYKEFTN